MYILQDKNIQDKLSTTGWARDWVWSIAYVMVQKFGTNPNVQLIPLSVEAWSQQWHTYRGNLSDTLTDLLPKLTFHEIEEEWQWKMVENHHQVRKNGEATWIFVGDSCDLKYRSLKRYCVYFPLTSTNMVLMITNIWAPRIRTLINCSIGNDKFNKFF